MIERMCKSCGRTFARSSTLQTICPTCAYNKYAKPKKPMKRIGKVGTAWLKAREQWIADNPPNHQGLWPCAIRISPNCLKWVDEDQLQVDHVVARSRDQSKRTDQNNLQPSCMFCNSEKGSKSLEEMGIN